MIPPQESNARTVVASTRADQIAQAFRHGTNARDTEWCNSSRRIHVYTALPTGGMMSRYSMQLLGAIAGQITEAVYSPELWVSTLDRLTAAMGGGLRAIFNP